MKKKLAGDAKNKPKKQTCLNICNNELYRKMPVNKDYSI